MDDLMKTDEFESSIKELQNLLEADEIDCPKEIAKESDTKPKHSFVTITDDKHEGWLYLEKPKEGKSYSKEEIIKYLEENGIRAGYIMSNISAMAKKGVYERSIKVALYKEAIPGEDGRFEFNVDVEALNAKSPRIRPDGSVDYTSMNILVGVAKDEVICRYHHATCGEDGYLVDGTPLYPAKTNELPVLKGKGFIYNEETGEYISEIDGKLDYKPNTELNIQNVLQIKGDVTQLNPRIDFNGNIEIDGNVESGAIIRCTRNVTITGVVEASEIYAGGDVVLKRGIQGSNKAKVISNGDVFADFIEHTSVKSKGNINSNTILNSEIFAEGIINLTGKKGTLVGGYSHARKGIKCVNLGTPAEVKTVAHVGLETKDYLKNQDIMKKDTFIREELKDILDKMNFIAGQRKIRSLTEKDIEEFNGLNDLKKKYAQELSVNKHEADEIAIIVEEAKDAEIRVEEHIYKGVIVAVDATRMPILDDTRSMVYRNLHGILEAKAIVL